MRELLVSELQAVNGGSVVADVGKLMTTTMSNREVTSLMLGLSAGMVIHAVGRTYTTALGVGFFLAWCAYDAFANLGMVNSSTTTVIKSSPPPLSFAKPRI